METGGRTLKEHIERQAGITFVESASGWKAPCPFEKNSTRDSFLVFNSPDGDFYCFSCKAKGGIADFDLKWRTIQPGESGVGLESGPQEAEPQEDPAPVEWSRARPGPAPVPPIPVSEPEAPPLQRRPASITPETTTAALVDSLRSQLDFMQRQNEGLHGLVLKYTNMLTGSRQLLLESKELLLEDNERKHKLELEVRLQQQKIEELERQLDRWRVMRSEMESFIETLESLTRKLRVGLLP